MAKLENGDEPAKQTETEDLKRTAKKWFTFKIARDLEKHWKIKGCSRKEASVTDQANGDMKKRKPRKGEHLV